MTTRLRIIGAASGLGAQDRGCADGPVAFHRSQAWHELADEPHVDWARTLFPPEMAGAAPVERVAALCRELADEVALTLGNGDFPLVIGGAIGRRVDRNDGSAGTPKKDHGVLYIGMDLGTSRVQEVGEHAGQPLRVLRRVAAASEQALFETGLAQQHGQARQADDQPAVAPPPAPPARRGGGPPARGG